MLARCLLILALLAAQQAALSHELWHADRERGQPAQQTLCDFHDALGAVLGLVDAVPVRAEALACRQTAAAPAQSPQASARWLIPTSRGPPAPI